MHLSWQGIRLMKLKSSNFSISESVWRHVNQVVNFNIFEDATVQNSWSTAVHWDIILCEIRGTGIDIVFVRKVVTACSSLTLPHPGKGVFGVILHPHHHVRHSEALLIRSWGGQGGATLLKGWVAHLWEGVLHIHTASGQDKEEGEKGQKDCSHWNMNVVLTEGSLFTRQWLFWT